MSGATNIYESLDSITEYFSPLVVAHFNDHKIEVVKAKGDFVWHHHENTDDTFVVLKGRVTVQLQDRNVELGPGDVYVVPRGLEHCPRAHGEAHILLIERAGTENTGTLSHTA